MVNSFRDLCLNLPQFNAQSVELGPVLGHGATATAFKCSFNGKSCAAKVMKSEGDLGSTFDESVATELLTLSKLGPHPNIVQCHGVCVDDASAPIIILELMEGKDLEKYLSQLKPGFDLGRQTIQKWSLDLLSALDFLHNRDPILIHCDVKPANLLLTPCRTSLKLTDFGIAKSVDRRQRLEGQLKANEGSPRYRAPEVLSRSGTAAYTEKSDIYSAALVMYYLLTGRRPENDVKVDPKWRPTLMAARMRWRKASDLLERMWAHEPEKRPTAGECAGLVRRFGEAEEDAPLPRGCYAGIRWPSQRRLVA